MTLAETTLGDRLRRALEAGNGRTPELLTGDLPGLELEAAPPGAAAAVLIAVTERPEPGIIFTQRSETLRRHAGQVAFPGGRIDPTDEDAVAAALREAHEEVALHPRDVRVIGPVDLYRTGTGFDVTPVLATVPADVRLVPSEAEVADVFEVPLAHVLDPAHQIATSRMWQGRERHYFQIDWQGRRIWGATAAMLVNLSRRLQW